ncbi:hypothetical protein IGI37_001969 [Enterococcus sp. AZ194]|uniref:aminotransferase-like domain-containing protein n=1 Tax=Enterococcus sp. AZ194 TaxID=2774629 RepID=UPI003F211851
MLKFERIKKDVKIKIKQGEYQAGTRIPSITKNATHYKCSRETVVKAYNELIREHILYAKNKSGYFVAGPKDHLETELPHYDLSTGNVRTNLFSLADAETNLIQGLDNYQTESLNYDLNGVKSLTKTLQHYLEDFNIFTSSQNIFITQGVHQVYTLLIRSSKMKPGKVLIENPTYSFALNFLKTHQLPYLTINRTENGLDMKTLRKLFKTEEIQFFYVIPRNHNPLGDNLPRVQIKEIARLAEQYNVMIIEDDYFFHGQTHSKSETIFENTRTNCFYLTSFTKIIPYLRLGYMIVPSNCLDSWLALLRHYYIDDYFAPSLLSQAVLETMIKNQSLTKYRQLLSKKINRKRKLIQRMTEPWQPEIAGVLPGTAGYYVSILLHQKINREKLQKKLLQQHQIKVANLVHSFGDYQHPYSHGIRISISKITEEALPSVLDAIYCCCVEELAQAQL